MTQHIGFVTTSWPSRRRPWAGHFVAGLAEVMVASGFRVSVVAPCFADDGGLETRSGISVVPAPVSGGRSSVWFEQWSVWPRVLLSMRRAVGKVDANRWLAHWWPTLFALPLKANVTSVLHGSDMDLLERLPEAVARLVSERGPVVAVAPGLADRFARRLGNPKLRPVVCPLGALTAEVDGPIPVGTEAWAHDPRPKVLTVARPSRGKGLEVAHNVAASNDSFAYLVVGDPPVSPAQVRTLLRHADLCVIPSRQAPDLPSEGRPHIIAQALVAGVPCLGGPNHAVRAAMREYRQAECFESDAGTLSRAIEQALCTHQYNRLKARALESGSNLTWQAVAKAWTQEVS